MNIEYVKFTEIDTDDFVALLNKETIREHLIEHELFDIGSVNAWVKSKLEIDSTTGCKVRAILSNNQLAGWCGIQLEDGEYEIAIIIDDSLWGAGKKIFSDIMYWAKELGHENILIHFLDSRPEYKFLRKISKKVYTSELLGRKFTTYQLAVK